MEDDPTEEFTTCYVQEEFTDNAEETTNPTSDAPLEEATQQDKQPRHQGGTANKGKEETDA
jgi:hypothetical protein